VLGIK
jgi:hypothetical protein